MDKAGSDLRSLLGTITYTVYTESKNPTYRTMVMLSGKTKYEVVLSDTGITVNGVSSDLSGIPQVVDSILMK